MINGKTPIDEVLCSKIWLKPIAHKQNAHGVEKIGLEMEMHAYDAETLAPLGTQNSSITPQEIMESVAAVQIGSTLMRDRATNEIIGVQLASGGNFSLEPGGQIEYSSLPCINFTELQNDVHSSLELLERVTEGRVLFLSHGTNPISLPTHPLVVPKERYKFMTRYFQSAPASDRGIHMMRHSASIQANLDIFENSEWHTGVHLTLNLIPITSVLFANARFFQDQKSQFYSERQNIWEHMDPTRSGFPVELLATPGCPQTECAYAKWAKRANMLFIEGLDIDEQPLYGELTFEQWLKNGFRGKKPTIEDWQTHLTTLFPHLRLRHFLEIRNVDAQPFEHTLAPVAFFSALLKTKETQKRTWDVLVAFKLDTAEIFKENQDFSSVFQPLLDLATEILIEHQEHVGARAVQAYKDFLTTREEYWSASSALEFVKKNATRFPARLFAGSACK